MSVRLRFNSRTATPPSFGGDTYIFEQDGVSVQINTAWGLLMPGRVQVIRRGVQMLDLEGINWLDEETARTAIEQGWL